MQRQFDDLQLGSIELFCLAAEAGSFTAAALVAGVTPAAVSRSVSRMEERLGVRLFARTTRSVNLTDSGRRYYEECRQALAQLVEAQREVMGQQQVPSGTLRISIPTTYAHHRILPLLPAFRARFPAVKVESHISNRNIDFVGEGYDMAIRVRAIPDSGLIARQLEDAALVMIASPEYLKRAGTPQTLDDLQQHECIQYAAQQWPTHCLVVQRQRRATGDSGRGQLRLFRRCVRWRHPGETWCRVVSDLSLYRRKGIGRWLAGGSAQTLWGAFPAVYPSLPAKSPHAPAVTGIH
ncbi:transcriptional regulator [Pseudomonas sp. G5(2012)]|nr:transcriptional regulator [Pseudomonas sp. G5(2012)]